MSSNESIESLLGEAETLRLSSINQIDSLQEHFDEVLDIAIEKNDNLEKVIIDAELEIENEVKRNEMLFKAIQRANSLVIENIRLNDEIKTLVTRALQTDNDLENLTLERVDKDTCDDLIASFVQLLRADLWWNELTLVNCYLSSDALTELEQVLKEDLCLQGLGIHFTPHDGPQPPRDVSTRILSALPRNNTLRTLTLQFCGIESIEMFSTVATTLIKTNNTLELLGVSKMPAENASLDVTSMANALATNKSSALTDLQLQGFGIIDDGMERLCKASVGKIQGLSLEDSQLGAKGISAMRKLISCDVPLRHLCLGFTSIDNAKISTLLNKPLAAGDNALRGLFLHQNYIGDKGAATVGNTLKHYKHLRQLDLSGNDEIGDSGARAIIEGVKVHSSITSVDLTETNVSEKVKDELAYYLELNKGPKTLLAEDLPLNLWPNVLERADKCLTTPSMLYYFVKGKVDLFNDLAAKQTRKRRRND